MFTELSLTSLETAALKAIIEGLYAEPGFSDLDAKDISIYTGISMSSLRGVLSSLVKKGIIQIDDNDAGYQIIYLNENYWHLHPHWELPEWMAN
jgi:hypothetical protein